MISLRKKKKPKEGCSPEMKIKIRPTSKRKKFLCRLLIRFFIVATPFLITGWILKQTFLFQKVQDPNPALIETKAGRHSKSAFIPTLRGKRIFFEVATVGLKQFSYLEDIIDAVRDMCEAGAHVSFHITSSNCNPNRKGDPGSIEEEDECPIKNQYSNTTKEDNFSVETISHLNERTKCRNPEGSLSVDIHLISPDWGKQIVDHHRTLFYENIENNYDVFVHTEDDTLIRPTTVLAFMHEMDKLEKIVGKQRITDYSIGFMRYENEMQSSSTDINWGGGRRRVIWEFQWNKLKLPIVKHPNLNNRYFTSPPPYHHQGMFMATTAQLQAWKTRQPDCHFAKIEKRPAYHRERTSGALDLYDEEYCNVTQLIPVDAVDDLLVHHLPNKNHQRTPWKVKSTRDLHKMRLYHMQQQQKMQQKQKYHELKQGIYVDSNGKYNGIHLFKDERNSEHSMHFDLKDYDEYVERGGTLTDKELGILDLDVDQQEN
mmetsp:Transcript_7480/g.8553  ORF Transcript_7480/g.8553 Transcript_7480/m.8553 type:complete len:486 (-) Transcript_7480:253-1710(-)